MQLKGKDVLFRSIEGKYRASNANLSAKLDGLSYHISKSIDGKIGNIVKWGEAVDGLSGRRDVHDSIHCKLMCAHKKNLTKEDGQCDFADGRDVCAHAQFEKRCVGISFLSSMLVISSLAIAIGAS